MIVMSINSIHVLVDHDPKIVMTTTTTKTKTTITPTIIITRRICTGEVEELASFKSLHASRASRAGHANRMQHAMDKAAIANRLQRALDTTYTPHMTHNTPVTARNIQHTTHSTVDTSSHARALCFTSVQRG
jgi:hypothetical protein